MQKIKALFPSWTDWVHFALGILSGVFVKLYPLLSLIITIVFLVYQFSNREPVQKTYMDILEFLAGYPIGIPLGFALYQVLHPELLMWLGG